MPEPGDWAVCDAGGAVGKAIQLGEWLNGNGFTDWEHAFVYVGGGKVLQAEPDGSKIVPLKPRAHILWSSGTIPLTPLQRSLVPGVAAQLTGVPYSFLDYGALAAHRLHIPVPGLRDYIDDSHHQICSQLVDDFMLRLGVHLFADGRWPGFVVPADLAGLLPGGKIPAYF